MYITPVTAFTVVTQDLKSNEMLLPKEFKSGFKIQLLMCQLSHNTFAQIVTIKNWPLCGIMVIQVCGSLDLSEYHNFLNFVPETMHYTLINIVLYNNLCSMKHQFM